MIKFTSAISREQQEAFDFARHRHLGQPKDTYMSLQAADWPDWGTLQTIEHNVANGILRWIAGLDEAVRLALAEDLLASIATCAAWQAFKARLWNAMQAEAWLARWDCWTPQSDLWQAAVVEVYHTLNAFFRPFEYGSAS